MNLITHGVGARSRRWSAQENHQGTTLFALHDSFKADVIPSPFHGSLEIKKSGTILPMGHFEECREREVPGSAPRPRSEAEWGFEGESDRSDEKSL